MEAKTRLLDQMRHVMRLKQMRIADGAGLRLMECVRLRVKDVDFAYQQITARKTESGSIIKLCD